MQEQLKNDIQDEISANKDLKTEISYLRAGQEDLRSEVCAMEDKRRTAELEERRTDKLDKQLKGVTSMVEQQMRNLREDIEVTGRDMQVTRRAFEAELAAAEGRTRRAGGRNGGDQCRQSEAA
jgi:predicted RNase H-like nuclease (RuvC/YqgF family)